MPTQKRLRELFEYRDGKLYNKTRRANSMPGQQAGTRTGFRASVCLDRKQILVHRIIWVMHHGCIPNGMEIDHIDGNNTNNKIENLRLVTHEENMHNQKRSARNKSGVTGVRWSEGKKRWRAEIRHNHRSISLGSYTSKQDAINARREAEKRYNYHENHGRVVE